MTLLFELGDQGVVDLLDLVSTEGFLRPLDYQFLGQVTERDEVLGALE